MTEMYFNVCFVTDNHVATAGYAAAVAARGARAL